jgi:hypothetical protein
VGAGSSPDNAGTGRDSQTTRARQAKREGVREKPASESLSIERTGSNLGDAGRDSSARRPCRGRRLLRSVSFSSARRPR